ncbi:MAG: methyltransferase [Elusimicrobiota bacterium]
MMALESAAASPAALGTLATGYRSAKLLLVAAKLELFTWLAGKRAGGEEIARAFGLHPRAAEIFLDALTALDLLAKTQRQYENTETAERLLVKGRPGYIGDNLRYQEFLWDSWSDLETTLRRGEPVTTLDFRLRGEKAFIRDYIGGMRDISRLPAAELAACLGPLNPGRMLDLGGGPGAYSLALLERNPRLEADILDLPETLRVTRKLIVDSPYRERLRLIEGSYHEAELEPGAYDLILLSHVTHNEGEEANRRLISRCRDALKPGGRLVIHDFMTDETGTAPAFSALFSVHMLVCTRAGRTYRLADYRRWIEECGFARNKRQQICADSPNPTWALIARK